MNTRSEPVGHQPAEQTKEQAPENTKEQAPEQTSQRATGQLGIIATEVVLPGVVEPSGLQLRQRTLPSPGAGDPRPDRSQRRLLRRAGHAA